MPADDTDELVESIVSEIDAAHSDLEALREQSGNARERGTLRRVEMALDSARRRWCRMALKS